MERLALTKPEYNEAITWSAQPARNRCTTIGAVAAQIVAEAEALIEDCRSPQRTDDVETIAAELIPLCDALRFLRRRGAAILRPRHARRSDRPVWLRGVQGRVTREPWGTVLIIGTWNYPLLLSGVQTAQALVAGNTVWLKPAPGAEAATARLASCFHRAGVPETVLRVLAADVTAASEAIQGGVDLVVLTGSAATGRRVLSLAADTLTPCIMELSGCDAVVVMPGADVGRVAAAVDFGMNFNGGATCIGPRRLIVPPTLADDVLMPLLARLKLRPDATVHPAARQTVAVCIEAALNAGAVDLLGRYDGAALRRDGRLGPVLLDRVTPEMAIAATDLFAPVLSLIRVPGMEAAIELVNHAPYRLAAAVFGEPLAAQRLAASLSVGAVTINDLIVPTADPRVPFGGRGQSGFGVTRGVEGLLAMTTPKVISLSRGRAGPHLSPRKQSDCGTLLGALQTLHGGSFRQRWTGLRRMIRTVTTHPATDSTASGPLS